MTALYDKILAEAAAERELSGDLGWGRRKPAPARKPAKPAPNADALRNLTLAQLALIIRADWANVNYAAVPYLEALAELDTVDVRGVRYYHDDASMIVAYFLSNARGWRGPTAKVVKAELKRRSS